MRKYEGGITTLENVDSEKNIGVTIDQHLNFEKTHPNANQQSQPDCRTN
jgi:hypothetical protein